MTGLLPLLLLKGWGRGLAEAPRGLCLRKLHPPSRAGEGRARCFLPAVLCCGACVCVCVKEVGAVMKLVGRWMVDGGPALSSMWGCCADVESGVLGLGGVWA